ncbi:MAG: VWA domain-containing protein, partial [Bradymonadaceae bacterium]
ICGFNQFVDEQRDLAGRANLTLTLFSHRIESVWTSVPLDELGRLTDEIFQPDGMTALMDAVGRTIERLE